MNFIVVTPPPEQPVSLAEVYGHLRIDPEGSPPEHPDDATLVRDIATATTQAEQSTKRAFVMQTIKSAAPCFPSMESGYIELRRPPFISIDLVKYYDANNDLQTLSPTAYYVDEMSDAVPRLKFYAGMAPSTYQRDDAVQVTWTVGYRPAGSPADDYTANIPAQLKSAVLLNVSLLYESLQPLERTAMERTRDALLDSFTVHSFGNSILVD